MTLNPPSGVARPAPVPEPPKHPPERLADPFRAPLVRHAMHIFIPKLNGKTARLEVREVKAGVRLYVDVDDDGIAVKTVDLSLSEATKLAEMLNAIRRRVVERKEWRP